MKTGVAHFLAFFLFLAAFADSARDFFMPIVDDADGNHPFLDDAFILHELERPSNEVPEAFLTDFCYSCLEISRKVKEILSHPTLFNEIGNLGTIFCHAAPSDSEAECVKMVEMQKREVIMFLQEILEEQFCNCTGFCPNYAQESSLSTTSKAELLSAMEHLDKMLTKIKEKLPMEAATMSFYSGDLHMDDKIPVELRANDTCDICLSILDKIRKQLEDPDKQLKIITSLLRACETEVFVQRCKRLVFAYGPMVISNLQEIVSLDLCHMVHICKYPPNQTDHMNKQPRI